MGGATEPTLPPCALDNPSSFSDNVVGYKPCVGKCAPSFEESCYHSRGVTYAVLTGDGAAGDALSGLSSLLGGDSSELYSSLMDEFNNMSEAEVEALLAEA